MSQTSYTDGENGGYCLKMHADTAGVDLLPVKD